MTVCKKTIDRVNEHLDALRNHYRVTIDLLVNKNIEYLKLNIKTSQYMFWFFKSGITNNVKTEATNCKIHKDFES